MNETEALPLVDYRIACPKCNRYETRIDRPQGVKEPCRNCGCEKLELIWLMLVPGPEDEFAGF